MSAVASAVRPANSNGHAALIREAVQDAVLELIFLKVIPDEKYEIRIKPRFSTAAWTFLPPHRIYVGEGIPDKALPELSVTDLGAYVQKHVFHEFAHLLWTDRKLKGLKDTLDAIPAPFSLFNLFEDARIEERFRTLTQLKFEWTRYEKVSVSKDPTSIFFALVQHEGDLERVKDASTWNDSVETTAFIEEVDIYYRRAIQARSSLELPEVIRDWVERFKQPPKSIQTRGDELGDGSGEGDLVPMLELPGNPEAQTAFDQGTESLTGGKSGGGKNPSSENSVQIKSEGNGELLAEERVPLDMRRVTRLSGQLGKLFESEVRLVSSEAPSRRISVRHLVLGRPPYRHRTERSRGSRKRIFLIVDCSGSMQGIPSEEGRMLVASASELARQGIVSGHVLLSAVDGDPPNALWQRFELPMPLEALERVPDCPNGEAEGLEAAIRANLKLIKQADYVLVYTDARITDAPIDKRALHLQGVHTWGLYVGSDPVEESLLRYFDKAIVRESAEQLIQAMLVHS